MLFKLYTHRLLTDFISSKLWKYFITSIIWAYLLQLKYPTLYFYGSNHYNNTNDFHFKGLSNFSVFIQVYKMNFDNAAFKHRMPQQKTAPSYEKLPMKRGIFFDMFPFSVIFRRDMTMYRIGDGLKEVFSDLQGKKVNEEFTLVRPMLEFSWDNVSSKRVVHIFLAYM